MTKGTVLVVGSNATRIELQGGGSAAIGQYLNETVVPAMALIEAGYAVVLATPDGTKPHIDAVSDSAEHFQGDDTAYARAKSFYANDPAMNQVRTLRSVIDEGLDGYRGLFVPGGHAPAVDLMQDADMGTVLQHFHKARTADRVALPRPGRDRRRHAAGPRVPRRIDCRGSGRSERMRPGWIYAGYRVSVFSASEERTAEDKLLHGKLYFTMPEALELAAATVSNSSADSAPNVVVDRELITGQNPGSDHLIAAKLIEALGQVSTIA